VRLRPARFVLAAAATTAGLAQPQSGGATAPAFEVASIKPSGPHSIRGSEGGPGSADPGLYRFGLATLLDLIVVAYHVEVFQVSGATPLDRQNFDLVAKIPEGATKQQFRAMLQNFLAERFHLKLHIQSKEFPAYELVVAKNGSKLKEAIAEAHLAPTKDGWPELPPNRPGMAANFSSVGGSLELVRLKAQQEPLSELARMLHVPDDLPVVEKTGLTGKFDLTLEYVTGLPHATPEGAADPPPAPFLFEALEKQLGCS
jgi:uncharacterized protein (TIGR03435 family)